MPKSDFYSFQTLIKERHWTKQAILKYLGEPDKSDSKKWYASVRVQGIESQAGFQKWLNKRLKKTSKISAGNALEVKRRCLLLDQLNLGLHLRTKSELVFQTCKYHSEKQAEKIARLDDIFSNPEVLTPNSPEPLLQRAAVNYLKSEFECKYTEIGSLVGKTEYYEAYAHAKRLIFKWIIANYPWLEAECERQWV